MSTLRRRLKSIIAGTRHDVLSPGTRVCVYGAGLVGRWTVRWLMSRGVDVVACLDRDIFKQGLTIAGVTVRSPDDLPTLAPDLILIATRHAVHEVANQLSVFDIPTMSVDALCASSYFDAFEDVGEGFVDDRSRETLFHVLEAMLTGCALPCERIMEKDQYFCLPAFCGREKEVYVDAGAYVGDSLERFIWAHYGVFQRAYAFEPARRQFEALTARSRRLCSEWALSPDQIRLVEAGLSNVAGFAVPRSSNDQLQSVALTDSLVPDEHRGVRTLRLDEALAGDIPTLIKADVEGMEMALLEGARETISTHGPKLAICVYHHPLDLIDLTASIKAMNPQYRFALRHHAPRLLETVLYATCEN